MVAGVYPNLRFDRTTTKLTDTSKTTVLTVGGGRLTGFNRVNLLGISVTDSTGSVATDASIFFTDGSDSDTEYTLINSGSVEADFPFQWIFSPAIPLFKDDTVKVTGGNGHHVLCVVQIPFDAGKDGAE